MPHASHVKIRTPSPARDRRLLAVLCALILLAIGAGSSSAIAHPSDEPTGAGSATVATDHGWSRCWRPPAADSSSHGPCWPRRGWRPRPTPRPPFVTPEPTVPAPTPEPEPEPTVPDPTAPEPTTPEPTVPEPTVPEPTTPEPTTPDPTTPEPSMPAPTGGIASAATTGVPSGVDLARSRGDLTITRDGTVIEGQDISGGIYVAADDVTIRSSRISGDGFAVIQVRNGSQGVTIRDVEIDGMGAQPGSMGVIGPADVSGADISGVENGLTPGSGSVLTNNYVHDLSAPGAPHYDGIQIDGGLSDITISRNFVDMSEHSQTAAIMIDNFFGPISDVTVDGNLLVGGGYTVYSDGQFAGGSITGVSFTNNVLGKGYYGYASIVRNTPVWSGNTDATTGRPVNR
jgi:hypothetical protein